MHIIMWGVAMGIVSIIYYSSLIREENCLSDHSNFCIWNDLKITKSVYLNITFERLNNFFLVVWLLNFDLNLFAHPLELIGL